MSRGTRVFEILAGLALAMSQGHAGELSVEALQTIMQTQLTHVDIDGDGVPDVIRRFNEDGGLVEMTWIDRSTAPETIQTTRIEDDGKLRVVTKTRAGRTLERVTERLTEDRRLLERETVSGDEHGNLTRRKLETPDGALVRVAYYDDGKLVRESALPSLVFEKTDSCPPLSGKPTTPEKTAAPVVPATAPSEKLLGSGYRLDLDSCKTPESRQVIEKATQLVIDRIFPCLSKNNSKIGAKFTAALAKSHFRIRCAGQSTLAVYLDRCKKIADAKERVKCLNEGQESKRTGAFHDKSFPDDIVLLNEDPGIHPIAAKMPEVLADLIGHETLHACGMPEDESQLGPHNLLEPVPFDSVYGCQSLCSIIDFNKPRRWTTQENCVGCRAEFNGMARSAATQSCMDYMPKTAHGLMIRSRRIGVYMDECLKQGKADSCTKVGKLSDFEVCAKIGKTIDRPECQKALKVRIQELMTAAEGVEGFRKAQAEWFNWDDFKKEHQPK